jgi:hypothetical protein
MDFSTWGFDPRLLDQASLSKHVAYESVDRFVTHTWMCQNVFLSVSRAYCNKNIKLLPLLSCLSFFYITYMIENYKWPSLQLFLIRWQALGTWLAYSNACLETGLPTARCGSFWTQMHWAHRGDFKSNLLLHWGALSQPLF